MRGNTRNMWLRVWALASLVVLAACGAPQAPSSGAQSAAPATGSSAAASTSASGSPAATGSSAERAVQAAKQYAGTTLNVTWEAGLQAQDPLIFSGPQWEKQTGIKINVVETPFAELFSKAIAEHQAATGAYDVISYAPAWIADLAGSGVLEPLDGYINKYGAELDDINPTYRSWMTWNNQAYGLADDGDVFVMYYRKDWFDDAQNKADFQAKYNRALAPPTTWDEWSQVCQFFTDKMAPNAHGCAIQRAAGQVFPWFEDHFRVNGGHFFDNNLRAGINSDVGVKTLTDMVASNKAMPPGIEKWGFVEVLSAWMDGKLGMIITWPPIGRWSEGYGATAEQLKWVPATKVAGKVGYAVPPGGHSELAGGFNLGVSADSKNKEAAYLFIQWLNSPEISAQRVKLPYALRDPFRASHYNDAEYKTLWPTAGDYLATLKQAGDAGLQDLAIPGAREYEEALDRAISAAYAGTDPKTALDGAAQEWNAITDRIGKDAQQTAYNGWVERGGKNAYP